MSNVLREVRTPSRSLRLSGFTNENRFKDNESPVFFDWSILVDCSFLYVGQRSTVIAKNKSRSENFLS